MNQYNRCVPCEEALRIYMVFVVRISNPFAGLDPTDEVARTCDRSGCFISSETSSRVNTAQGRSKTMDYLDLLCLVHSTVPLTRGIFGLTPASLSTQEIFRYFSSIAHAPNQTIRNTSQRRQESTMRDIVLDHRHDGY